MKQRLFAFLICLACLSPVYAESVEVTGHHEDYVFEGRGRDFYLSGHHNDVIIHGKARRIIVEGHHDDLVVDSAEEIIFKGHHNDVLIENGDPIIRNQGAYNDVVYSDGSRPNIDGSDSPSSSDEVVINGTSSRKVYQGQNRDFVINGASHAITIQGRARSVTLNGASNLVTVEQADEISVTGMSNRVHYKRGNPETSNTGVSCSIERR